jgi:hypothetical protein
MYNEKLKLYIDKWVKNNRSYVNDYQKQKQKEYYKNNPDIKLRKQNEYKYKKITAEFRNILIS